MFSSRRGKVIGAVVGIPICAGTGLVIASYYDEGIKRSLQFWSNIFPVYIHYRATQFLNRDLGILSTESANLYYEKLHVKYADKVRDLTYKMRGFYLKQAQLMSTQDDFVPKPYMSWVKHTQDNVPSEFEEGGAKIFCRKMLKEELGMDFDQIFSEWDDIPLGVASIGQVHKAKLRSNGKYVAVKLQLPGIEQKFRSDIRTLKRFCDLAMPQHSSAFVEVEKQFLTEFDYRKEGLNLAHAREAVMPKWGKLVEIPAPYLELCSKHVLVMDYLKGVKLVDGVRAQYSRIAASMGKTLEELEAEHKLKIMSGEFTFKTVAQDIAEKQRYRLLLTLHDAFLTANPLRLMYNLSVVRLIYGPIPYYHTERPIDLGRILDIICRVHATELFHEGLFNGDPHPGNILLLEDNERIGLIDYGQVKVMSVEERIKYAKLIVAHARGDVEEVVRIHFDELGVKTQKGDKQTAYLFSSFHNDRNTSDVCGDMNISQFIDWLEMQDRMVRLPEEFLMAGRLSFLLRGMGNAFGLQLRMSQMWEEDALEFLKNQGINY